MRFDEGRLVEHLQGVVDGDLRTAEGLHQPHCLGDLHRAGLRAGLAGMAVSGAPLGPDEQLPGVRWTFGHRDGGCFIATSVVTLDVNNGVRYAT